MRASRMLKLLMTLQVRSKVTATELADICETSVRTVYRDIESLSAMGVPVYSVRGIEGGYRLLHGYRTQLNGLSSEEVETLFLAGLKEQTQTMGLQSTLADAQLKLMAALPEKMRHDASRLQSRFLLDAPNWFSNSEQVEHLPELMAAVREQRIIEMSYQRWNGIRQRRAQPLGVVLKGGQWYMVATVDEDTRIYRISRILSLTLNAETFNRPADFNLSEFWQANLERVSQLQFPLQAKVRITPQGIKLMKQLCAPYVFLNAQIEPIDANGWHLAQLPIGNLPNGCNELLQLGPEVEVIDPPDIRQAMQALVKNLDDLYPD